MMPSCCDWLTRLSMLLTAILGEEMAKYYYFRYFFKIIKGKHVVVSNNYNEHWLQLVCNGNKIEFKQRYYFRRGNKNLIYFVPSPLELKPQVGSTFLRNKV